MYKKLLKLFKQEKGEINLGGVILLGLAMVFIAVGFIMLPIATNAAQSILDYSYTTNCGIIL